MTPHLKQIVEHIRQTDNFLVLSHVSPDGDALGSMLAMGELLAALGKRVALFNESGIPNRFAWLSPKREILTALPAEKPDTLIVLDCGSAERTGDVIKPWLTGRTADGCCRFATGAYTESAYFGDGLTIAVGRDKAALRNEINGALRDLETDGVLDELALRFLPMSLY